MIRNSTKNLISPLSPAEADIYDITYVASNQKAIRFAADVQHFTKIQRQCVVAASCDIDHLNIDDAVIPESRQVQ